MRRIGALHLPTAVAALLLGNLFLYSQCEAVDGVIEINQVRAQAGEVTTGDTPGFPVTISQPGSYRLTGNLTVSDPDLSAVEITAPDVTLDLNGFTLQGPTSCAGTPPTCTPSGLGSGFTVTANDVTIRNGTIRGFPDRGIFADSTNQLRAEDLHIEQNGWTAIAGANMAVIQRNTITRNRTSGIELATRSTVADNIVADNGFLGIRVNGESVITGNVVQDNGGPGIVASTSSNISNNVVSSNEGNGISASGGMIWGNTVSFNEGIGLDLNTTSGYGQNVLDFNDTNVVGGVQLGPNSCSGSICP